MGRKSREKRERRAVREKSVSLHEVLLDGEKLFVREWHEEGVTPISTNQFEDVQLLAQVGESEVDLLVQKLVDQLPRKRIITIIPENYVRGKTPINVGVYPKLTERQLKKVENVFSEMGG